VPFGGVGNRDLVSLWVARGVSRGAARIAGAMSKHRHLHWFCPLLLACALLSFATAAQDQGAAQNGPTSRSPADACLEFAAGCRSMPYDEPP
jgi:hypothetical protein